MENVKAIAFALAALLAIGAFLGSCDGSSDSSYGGDRPKTAEEAASHYYYDNDGHIHRDY